MRNMQVHMFDDEVADRSGAWNPESTKKDYKLYRVKKE